MVKMRPLASLLALLLSLSLVHPCIGDPSREMVVVFKGDQTEVPYDNNNGIITMRKPRAFRVPAFVGGVFNNKEFLAVFCDARYLGFSDWSFIEAAARTCYGDYKNWSNATIFAKNTRRSLANSVVGDITAVIKGKKIFVLAPSWDTSSDSWVKHNSLTGWDPLLIVGTVEFTPESEGGSASINWELKRSLKRLLPSTVNGAQGSQFIGGVGNGVVMKNGTIVFPIQIATKNKQVSSTIMYSTDDGANWIMGRTTSNGPSECSVVEWGEGKLVLTTRYDHGHRKVYESNNMGKNWRESLMFSQVWGNQPNRQGVGSQGTAITVSVDKKDVLLFSHPLNRKGRYSRDTLQLWMSDGQRIVCVGTISETGKGEGSGYSILAHVGDNLYSMHEINPYGDWNKYNATLKTWDRVIALSPLSHCYEIVKNTVHAWRHLDAGLETKGVPINALVGHLGNSNSDTVWEDMYKCVNANVNGATRVPKGFRFNNTLNSGAQWPVSSQGQNQVYIFTKKQFTLAAKVTIHTTSSAEDVLLLGAKTDGYGSSLMLGLGYTKDNKWYAVQNRVNKVLSDVSFVPDMEHYVAITFTNGKAAVYVDGTAITDGKIKLYSTVSISHFFMGGMGKSSKVKGGSCTVKNVMLFNRALSQEEITLLTNVNKDDKQSESTLTAEAKIPQTDLATDSTVKTTTAPANLATVSTATTTTAPGNLATVSTTTTTTAPPNLVTVSATTTTSTAANLATVSTAETTTAPPNIATVSTAKITAAPENIAKDSTTETTSAPAKIATYSTTESTMEMENRKEISTAEPKKVSATLWRKVTNEERSDKQMNISLHENGELFFKKYAEGDNGTVMSFAAVAWMCVVCSFIVLTEF